MNSKSTSFNDKKRKLWGYRAFFKLKKAYQLLKSWPDEKHIVFILGCQRSGTTLMTRIFNRDLQTRVYTAFSDLSSLDPDRLRLDPHHMIAERFRKDNAAMVVAKPIVESQNAIELLEFFKDAKAIWMFRNPNDVVRSNMKRFGKDNGIKDLLPVIRKEPGNWRSEKVTSETVKVLSSHFSETIRSEDAAALFWYCRNRLFFDQQLQDHPRVKLCLYDDLVTHPVNTMKDLYHFIGRSYPGKRLVREVNPYSVNKGKDIELTDEIRRVCDTLYKNLLDVHRL